jgi:hypothetical protein
LGSILKNLSKTGIENPVDDAKRNTLLLTGMRISPLLLRPGEDCGFESRAGHN